MLQTKFDFHEIPFINLLKEQRVFTGASDSEDVKENDKLVFNVSCTCLLLAW